VESGRTQDQESKIEEGELSNREIAGGKKRGKVYLGACEGRLKSSKSREREDKRIR